MLLQEPVQAAVWDALNHYAFPDATFLAERLYSEVKTSEALYLLATCYYRSGKSIQAYSLLQTHGCPTPQCKFLMAKCCTQVNKLSEAEAVLAGNVLTQLRTHEEIITEFGSSACHIFSILGHIYSKTERTSRAVDCYKKSLKLNPLLWASYERLCQIGEKLEPNQAFQLSSNTHFENVVKAQTPVAPHIVPGMPHIPTITTDSLALNTPENIVPPPQNTHHNLPLHPNQANSTTPQSPDPLLLNIIPTAPKPNKRKLLGFRNLLDVPPSNSPLTPSFGVLPLETPSPAEQGHHLYSFPLITPSPLALTETQPLDVPNVPIKLNKKPVTRRNQNQSPAMSKPPVLNLSSNLREISSSAESTLQSNISNVRRSTRLFSNSNANNSVKENNNKAAAKTKFSNPRGPLRKSRTKLINSQDLNELNKNDLTLETKNSANADALSQAQLIQLQRQSLAGILSLLQSLGKAYIALSQYECQKAIDLLTDLPPQHYNTAWVLSLIGRAYFELSNYQEAEKIYAEVRRLDPYHLEGMEFYSTALWHLHKEMPLSCLSQELTDIDKNSVEAWCVTGNCFSAQKEHDTAIKFFQRAIQVNPDFAYAYTLLGHEYVLTEELEKGSACFRSAIRIDPRHYNAWYGLGMIYHKQEKFALAEVHFKKAMSINPSSVILCHIGVVQHAQQKTDNALNTLNKAISTDPKNPLCKFHRASVLFTVGRHKEALSELEELKHIIPKESLVYFLMGKVHKKLGNTHLALMNFSWATDLDPKGTNNQIKEAIDKRYATEDDDPTRLDDTGAGLEDDHVENANGIAVMATPPNNVFLNSNLFGNHDGMQLQAMESDDSF